MQKTIRANKFIWFFGLFIALQACTEQPLLDEFVPLNKGWHKDSIVHFNVQVVDTVNQFYPVMQIRHNNAYNYANLYLFRTISSVSGIEYQDTVNLAMADQTGKWLGSGFGELKLMEWGYGRQGLRFTHGGTYTFSLQQGMRDTVLQGITDVGLQIKKINTEK